MHFTQNYIPYTIRTLKLTPERKNQRKQRSQKCARWAREKRKGVSTLSTHPKQLVRCCCCCCCCNAKENDAEQPANYFFDCSSSSCFQNYLSFCPTCSYGRERLESSLLLFFLRKTTQKIAIFEDEIFAKNRPNFLFFRRDGLNLAQILLQQPKIATNMHQISSKKSTQNPKNRKNLDFHQFFQSIFLPQKKFLQENMQDLIELFTNLKRKLKSAPIQQRTRLPKLHNVFIKSN